MRILVNNKETEIASHSTVAQLAITLGLPGQGVAIAVNNKMVPKTQWDAFELHENDNVVIIKAACGG